MYWGKPWEPKQKFKQKYKYKYVLGLALRAQIEIQVEIQICIEAGIANTETVVYIEPGIIVLESVSVV